MASSYNIILTIMDLGQIFFNGHPLAAYKDRPLTDLLSIILPNIYILAGIIIFLYFIFGGFLIISGGGNPKNMDQGKEVITKAIAGFAIIFTSYWLIQIIEIITGIPILHANF